MLCFVDVGDLAAIAVFFWATLLCTSALST